MKEGEDITFDQLLVNLKLTEQNYLLAVQSSLKTQTIFLKRKPNELRINNYNAAMSQCMACKYGYSVCTRCIFMCNIHCIIYIQGSKRHE
jgi:hypothetical protein